MLVQIVSDRPSSIMDSPTLARVERAILRHHQQNGDEDGTSSRIIARTNHRSNVTQSLIPSNFGTESGYHAIKRGLLWQQRGRLFSRWKERYFILTRDYLHCFRRDTSKTGISEMGQFLFKIKLVDVDKIEWINKKTYSTVALELGRDGKVLLRSGDGLEDWFELLEECMLTSKERRRALKYTHDTASRRNNNNSINSSLEEWLTARQKVPQRTDTASTIRDDIEEEEDDDEDTSVQLRNKKWDRRMDDVDSWILNENNRLSLLTDIDISSYGNETLEAPSVAASTTYRHSEDVYCISRNGSSLRGSFRAAQKNPINQDSDIIASKQRNGNGNGHGNGSGSGYTHDNSQPQLIKFRERSHSDIQRLDRRPWRLRAEIERRALYN